MDHNLGTWYNCSQVNLTNEQSCQKNKLQNKIQIRKTKSARKQLSQCHLGTNVPFSLENNRASHTWEQSWQPHLGTIVLVSFGNNFATVTSEQFHQLYLRTNVPVTLGAIVAVSLGNNRGNFTWVQLCQFYLEAILPVQFALHKK